MHDIPDAELLERFARSESEEAFAELVRRHIALVHSVALRHTDHSQHAQEITQAVFIILARKAASLGRKTVLGGWLYHTARLTAANFRRAECRRVRREQEAFMQSTLEENPSNNVWQELSPLLDEAMSHLGATDRDAVVLRFFENKSLAEVGTVLGLEERAAQKRVNRALEKLRKIFSKRGVTLSATLIAGAVSSGSVQAAPVGLTKIISAVAITKGVAAGGSTLTLVKGALKIMAWTKAKTAIVVGVSVLLAAGTTTSIIVHHRTHSLIFSSTRELSESDNASYTSLTGTTPAQAARTYLEACGREDWAEVAKYWPPGLLKKYPTFADTFKSGYGGLEIVSLGKPFKGSVIISGGRESAGVFVPYEIRLKDGNVKKWQLSIRCDNPEHRWYFDGGL